MKEYSDIHNPSEKFVPHEGEIFGMICGPFPATSAMYAVQVIKEGGNMIVSLECSLDGERTERRCGTTVRIPHLEEYNECIPALLSCIEFGVKVAVVDTKNMKVVRVRRSLDTRSWMAFMEQK